jgi:hypothetical protein
MAGSPDGTVRGDLAPYAVVVKIFVADYSRRNVPRRYRFIFPLVARTAPAIEPVECRRLRNRVFKRVAVAEAHLFIRLDPHARSVTCGVPLALANSDDCCVTIRVHIEAIITGFLHGERDVRGVDLIDFGTKQMAHMKIQGALMQFNLNSAVVDICQGQAALRIQSEDAPADVQFRL